MLSIRPSRIAGLRLLEVAVVAMALAVSGKSAWSQEPLYERVFASPEWQDFRDTVVARHVDSVGAVDLQRSCLQALDAQASDAIDVAVIVCMQAAIKGLGTNAAYFSVDEHESRKREPNPFVGIGLELRKLRDGAGVIEVVSALHGSPAEKAGLLVGDQILSVAGRPTFGISIEDSVRGLRGVPGSYVDLRVRRQGTPEILRFSIKREPMQPQSVKGGLLAPGVLWIRLTQLRDETGNDVVSGMARWQQSSTQPLTQVILDLRGCPGGVLEAVVAVAALWTSEGTPIVRQVERAGPPGRLYRARSTEFAKANVEQLPQTAVEALQKLPLAILVNHQTAAGAEALAQALRDRRGARLFGQPTFGLAEVDTVLNLHSGAAIRIATGRLESPSGLSWASKGIQPDVLLPKNDVPRWEFGNLSSDMELAAVLKDIGDVASNDPRSAHPTRTSR